MLALYVHDCRLIGAWELVFRVTSGGNYTVLDMMRAPGGINENDESLQTIDASVQGVYKSAVIDRWGTEHIARVSQRIGTAIVIPPPPHTHTHTHMYGGRD